MLTILVIKVSNFQSLITYDFFLNCNKKHKAWQSFEVLLHGTIKEMVKVYLFKDKEEPSVLKVLLCVANISLVTVIYRVGLCICIKRVSDRKKWCYN